uniref:Uncharacterized protein n=1 Tax=Glossina palpalis gambiensis TaxID=67801 RepID=A0A1B0BE14_9MUSC
MSFKSNVVLLYINEVKYLAALRVINLNATQGNVERLTFVNHTEYHCVGKSKQSAPEYAVHYHRLNDNGLENLSHDQCCNVRHATLKGDKTFFSG